MSGNLLVRFDEGRVGRTAVSPSPLLYRALRENLSSVPAAEPSLLESRLPDGLGGQREHCWG